MAVYENILNDNVMLPIEIFIQDTSEQSLYVTEHYHECFEILYMLSGDAEQLINCNTYEAKTGDVILIKSGDIHQTYCPQVPSTQIFVLKFMPSIIDSGYSGIFKSKYLAAFLNYNHYCPILSLDKASQQYFSTLLKSIAAEYSRQKKGYDLYIKGYILELMGFLVRQNLLTLPSDLSDSKKYTSLHTVIKYIEENYFLDISLTDISKLLNMNYSYVSRYFKKITGRSFKQFLDYVRVCEAGKQLVTTNKSITTIAFDCGFSSLQAFTRTYTKFLGFPPSKLRSKKVLNTSKK